LLCRYGSFTSIKCQVVFFPMAWQPSIGPGPSHYRGFTITLNHTLYEWSARRKAIYLTSHTTHDRKTSMPPAGFEPAISASEWPQSHPLDRSATGNGQIDAYTIHTPMTLRHSEHCMIIAIMQSKWFRHRPLQVTCSNRDTLKWISMLCLVVLVLVLRVAVGFGVTLKGCHCRSSQLCMVLDLHGWLWFLQHWSSGKHHFVTPCGLFIPLQALT